MSEKYIVIGATGSIGSSLAEQLVSSGNNVHLVARNDAELQLAVPAVARKDAIRKPLLQHRFQRDEDQA